MTGEQLGLCLRCAPAPFHTELPDELYVVFACPPPLAAELILIGAVFLAVL